MLRRLPTITPRQYERVTLVALVLLFLIVLTGSAVRLTDSGLGCTNWPRCGDHIVAPLQLHAWIEFGNRLVTGLVAFIAAASWLLAFRRVPRRRDLTRLSVIPALGVVGQAVLGGLVVIFELKPGMVMGHFGLSMLILGGSVVLYWRARQEPEERPVNDRRLVLLTRALLLWGAFVLFAGTVATAAGPHPGSDTTHEGHLVPRITWMGLDELIHWHARTGTVLGLLAVGTWLFARKVGASRDVRRALTAVCLLVATQGVVGFAQYELELPAGLVWIHVAVASATWLSILFAVMAAGRLVPATSEERHPHFWGGQGQTSVEQATLDPS